MTTPETEKSPPSLSPEPKRSFLRRHWGKLTLAALVVMPALVFTIWAGIALTFTYSSGRRVGYVQKFSKKGWICKTWEGELAMVNLPGAMSQIFTFTVRSDSVAVAVQQAMTKGRVELSYEQHIGVPTACFGETEYFVKAARAIAGP